MTRQTATFEVDSKSDLYAVQRILEQAHNTIREESQNVRRGTDSGEKLLGEFQSLRDAAERRSPGRLTITYERDDGELGD